MQFQEWLDAYVVSADVDTGRPFERQMGAVRVTFVALGDLAAQLTAPRAV
jgi:hypothetical protein